MSACPLVPGVSDASPDSTSASTDPPDRPPGKRAFIEALEVRRNAVRGFAAAVVFSLAVFGFFVLVPGTSRPVALYATLTFVLAMSLGVLLTTALVVVRAARLA